LGKTLKKTIMGYGMKYTKGGFPFKEEMPKDIAASTRTDYKKSKSGSTPNEKTAKNYDMHDVHAEQENPTDGRYCATCGVAKEDHDATHPFKPNYNK
jgi:hypothetical protein